MKRCTQCKEFLFEKNISNKKDFLEWALKNHPDKGGDVKVFDEISSCNDEYFGINPKCVWESTHENPKNNDDIYKKNPSPKYENVPRYEDKDIKYENFDNDIKEFTKDMFDKYIDISKEALEYLNLIINKLIFYIVENTTINIKDMIKNFFTLDLANHAISQCSKSKKITKLIFDKNKVKNILLKYYVEDISDKQLKIITCLLEYIYAEILENSLKNNKNDKIDINNIKDGISNDKEELNILINLVLNVPNPKKYSITSPIKKSPRQKKLKPCNSDQIRNPKTHRCVLKRSVLGKKLLAEMRGSRRTSPKRVHKSRKKEKTCNSDQIRNPKSGRCVLKRTVLGKKLLAEMRGSRRTSPRRTSPRRASPRRTSPRRASPKKKSQKLKRCDPDKIRNPKTKRCVLKRSVLGKKLLEKKMARQKKSRKNIKSL